MKENVIDFVILWVDGNDKNWQQEKEKYMINRKKDNSNSDNRYRDWENLKYWFRAVEKYTPWVNKIHFITWGHMPEWLNTENCKLNIVNHKDFIPSEYLPTFNSNVIELNLHRIKELNENFVLFNDDFFINKNLKEEFFFKDNLPCDIFSEDIIMPNEQDLSGNLYKNEEILNKYYRKKEVERNQFLKVYNPKYGKYLLRNILLKPWQRFSTFKNLHLPQSLKKSTVEILWKKEYDRFNNTCKNKFRTNCDITQYLFRDWQLAGGIFTPVNSKRGKYYNIGADNKAILADIMNGKSKLICLNDVDMTIDFERTKIEINKAFEYRLNKKSSYEK